jgi:dUTP pyrophosphatase
MIRNYMPLMNIKIINESSNPLPGYETRFSAGMDLRAFLPEGSVHLESLKRALIPTGLFIEIPEGFEGQIRPRSGLALKQGITVLNSPGTIDSDYRGEIKILLINLSDLPVTISNGDRIAQIIFARHENIQWIPARELEPTDRGSGGYGHTGIS